jgi:gliding motility-associated lipoprotein GldH
LKTSIRYYIPFLIVVTCCILSVSCTQLGVFEKHATIPNQAWSSKFKPDIAFTIQGADTLSRYNVYLVLRHTDAYRYKNIWLNVRTKAPNDSTQIQPLNLQLATDNKGWLGSGMDDIFEHRILITPPQYPARLNAGTYHFELENIMREDPLKNIMNVGIRLEKAQ